MTKNATKKSKGAPKGESKKSAPKGEAKKETPKIEVVSKAQPVVPAKDAEKVTKPEAECIAVPAKPATVNTEVPKSEAPKSEAPKSEAPKSENKGDVKASAPKAPAKVSAPKAPAKKPVPVLNVKQLAQTYAKHPKTGKSTPLFGKYLGYTDSAGLAIYLLATHEFDIQKVADEMEDQEAGEQVHMYLRTLRELIGEATARKGTDYNYLAIEPPKPHPSIADGGHERLRDVSLGDLAELLSNRVDWVTRKVLEVKDAEDVAGWKWNPHAPNLSWANQLGPVASNYTKMLQKFHATFDDDFVSAMRDVQQLITDRAEASKKSKNVPKPAPKKEDAKEEKKPSILEKWAEQTGNKLVDGKIVPKAPTAPVENKWQAKNPLIPAKVDEPTPAEQEAVVEAEPAVAETATTEDVEIEEEVEEKTVDDDGFSLVGVKFPEEIIVEQDVGSKFPARYSAVLKWKGRKGGKGGKGGKPTYTISAGLPTRKH